MCKKIKSLAHNYNLDKISSARDDANGRYTDITIHFHWFLDIFVGISTDVTTMTKIKLFSSIDDEDKHQPEPTDEIVELTATTAVDNTKLMKILFVSSIYITVDENSYLFSTPDTDRSQCKHVSSINVLSLTGEISDLNSTSSATNAYESQHK
jgi:hypothetical protein